jgi:hemerythrin-like domain-containing protein
VIEEEYFYPAVRKHVPNGGAIADKALQEHQTIKELLVGFDDYASKLDDRPENWPVFPFENFVRLQTEVTNHVNFEESQIFPQLKTYLTPLQLEDLAKSLHSARKIAPTRPHPSAPNKPPMNKV